MLKQALALVVTLLIANTGLAQLSEHEMRNKAIVLDFYNKGINEKDYQAASIYLDNWYIQHNPTVEDGPEGFEKLIDYIKENYPDAHSTIKQVFVQDDYVVLHILSKRTTDDIGRAIVDIFRLENEKIVEHWDVIQSIPAESKNNNGMF